MSKYPDFADENASSAKISALALRKAWEVKLTEPLSADDLIAALQKQNKKESALTEDQLQEYAIQALHGLRGLFRSDKLKVIRRMRRLLDA